MAKKQKSPSDDEEEEEEPTPLLDLAAARLVKNTFHLVPILLKLIRLK